MVQHFLSDHDRQHETTRTPGSLATGELTCLLIPLPNKAALSLALVRCLTEELPEIRWVLHDRFAVDAIWLCGHGPRAVLFLPQLRTRYPLAAIVVTGRAPTEAWAREVLAAGADHACSWPLNYSLLGRVLHTTTRRESLRETEGGLRTVSWV